jgi:hypothetical protein
MVRAAHHFLRPLLPGSPVQRLVRYVRFWGSYLGYRRLSGAPVCDWADLDIQLDDWRRTTPVSYYFYQDTWAFRKIVQARPALHVDIGSTALLVGCVAAMVPTISVDVRPLAVRVDGLTPLCGLITRLPFRSDSLESISALCVIEHIGLGRYGDPLDPDGTRKAARELVRVLARGGNLYVSVPCGRSYVAFNAHRSFARDEFEQMFGGLQTKEYLLVSDLGTARETGPGRGSSLQVGLFHFSK